jgi:putative oxidoreductase
MLFPELARFTDVGVLLLRVMVGVVFVTSGWNHLRETERGAKTSNRAKALPFS